MIIQLLDACYYCCLASFLYLFNQNNPFWFGSQLTSREPQLLNTFTDGKFLLADYEFLFHMMILTLFSYVPLQIWFLFLISHFQNGRMGSKQVPAVAWVRLWHHQCSLKDSWHKGPCWCQWMFSCMCLHTQAINANVETITLKAKRKRGSY